MSYVTLLNISSESYPLKDTSNIPNKLLSLYENKNGFLAFESSLKIYTNEEIICFNDFFS